MLFDTRDSRMFYSDGEMCQLDSYTLAQDGEWFNAATDCQFN
jgi:hypothetical protein